MTYTSNGKSNLESPATQAFAITPSDSTDLAQVTRAIYTGTGGDITCILADDTSSVTFQFVPAGAILPLRVKRILSTGTTSSGMIGLL